MEARRAHASRSCDARRLVCALAAGLSSLALGNAVSHAQAAAQLEVRQFGWRTDGTLAAGTWNPVSVRVTGENVARVQAILKFTALRASQSTLVPVATYGQDMATSQEQTHDVKLWVPLQADGGYVVTVQALNPGGQILAEQSASGQSARSDIPFVASIADNATLAAQLGRIEVPYQQGLTATVRTAELKASDVPGRSEYLGGLQGLAVQGGSVATLTGEQKRAIQEWVVRGGHLLIFGGSDASRAMAVLDGLNAVDMRFTGVDGSTNLEPLVDWASANPDAAPGSGATARIQAGSAEVLAGAADRPLAVRANLGDGTITLLAADPTQDPLRGWSNTPILLQRALQPALASASTNVPYGTTPAAGVQPRLDDARLLGALDALPAEAFPDWQHVALILGGFAFVAGPLLHLVLWRADRRTWLWIAVPVLAIGVTAGIYIVSASQPGRDVVANTITEIRVDPATGDAREAVGVGYFAPLRDQLSVKIAGEVPVRVWLGSTSALDQGAPYGRSTQAPLGGSTEADPGFRVIIGRDTQVDFVPTLASQNPLRSMVLSRTLPRAVFGQLEADLHIQDTTGLIRGSVRNATPYPMDEVGLAIGQRVAKLGPMAPGQTTPVLFDARVEPPTAPGNVVYSFGWQLYGTPSTIIRGGSALDLPSDPDVLRRVKMMDTVLSAGDRSSGISYGSSPIPVRRAPSVRPMLVAVSSASIAADFLPSAGAQRTFQLNVIEVPVDLSVAPGPFALTSQLLPPSVSVDTGASLTASGNYAATTGFTLNDLRGSATYTFHVGLPPGAHVDQLVITTKQASVPPAAQPGAPPVARKDAVAPATEGTFSIFNWQTADWQPLMAGATEVQLQQAGSYVAPDGTVRVRVTSGGADRTVRFAPPALTVMGEAAP